MLSPIRLWSLWVNGYGRQAERRCIINGIRSSLRYDGVAGMAVIYYPFQMRGIVVRSRQRRKADEKADAIVHPQETAERKLAKRAVKVEKRKRAMKEKVQEWRGLKQRKL